MRTYGHESGPPLAMRWKTLILSRVCDKNEEFARKAAEELDAKVFTSYPEDACERHRRRHHRTPNSLHASMAIAAAEKKKATYSTEKPMAPHRRRLQSHDRGSEGRPALEADGRARC